MEKNKTKDSVLNVSGSFQISSNKQQKDVKKVENDKKLDEGSMYYARLFMED
ncbi:hypothetical protein LGQ02_11665 [Bacillus shivajii]|uniref:hypothetical protein n=1 Tax=Bacillus shivajii TaxID=1983719 RepID=UPI001CFBA066|nr:hypothetical protein [Bacillus shivajii]UCZ51529.1 hypothetical protein LGQ02_11665 [Bacillus shivajii]